MEASAVVDEISLSGADKRVDDLLVELSLFDEDDTKELNIVLISDNEEMKKLNYFIFNGVDGINYYTMDSPYDRDLSIISQMDIIIYNKIDDSLEELLLKNIKNRGLNCKFFHIINEKYFRKVDLLNEYFKGVDRVLKIDIELKEYIFELQRELRSNFYSKRLSKIKPQDTMLSRDSFEIRKNELIKNRVFFSKVTYRYESDINIKEYNLKKVVRELDSIYIDEKSKEISFILLDIMPKKANYIIKKRMKNFSIYLDDKAEKSVFDLLFD